MATYRLIAATETDPEAPITSALMKALDENATAISEGASGAPRILDAALGTSVTTTGQSWVGARLTTANVLAVVAGGGTGEVGTYAFLLHQANATAITAGANYSGSVLRYSGVNTSPAVDTTGGTPAGTWKAMGTATSIAGQRSGTLFLRIT